MFLLPCCCQCSGSLPQSAMYSKTRVKWQLSKRPKIIFQDQLSLNAGQKYCKMLQGEHSAILLTFIKLPFVIKIFVLSIFERPFYRGFAVVCDCGIYQLPLILTALLNIDLINVVYLTAFIFIRS